MSIQTVGVVGGGVMGVGVAHNLVQTGHNVILIDISDAILEHAKEEITRNMRLQRMLAKKREQESIDTLIQRITFTQDYGLFTDVDFVIENATEKWDIKKKIYEQIDAICPRDVIFAVNTSAISITRVGSATTRPQRVIGTHFMNPVPMKNTVEVIRGYHTSEETIATTRALLASMGKEGIVVNDMPGFVSNRVLMLTVNEAIYLVQDQVATAEEVDRVFKSCFGQRRENGGYQRNSPLSRIDFFRNADDQECLPVPRLRT